MIGKIASDILSSIMHFILIFMIIGAFFKNPVLGVALLLAYIAYNRTNILKEQIKILQESAKLEEYNVNARPRRLRKKV